jgi:hypothetical protein
MEARKCLGPDLISRKNRDAGMPGGRLLSKIPRRKRSLLVGAAPADRVPLHGGEERHNKLRMRPLTEGKAGGSGLWLQGKRLRNEFPIPPDSIPEHLASAFSDLKIPKRPARKRASRWTLRRRCFRSREGPRSFRTMLAIRGLGPHVISENDRWSE